ncbi:MAG: hypothetical protein GC172_04960 [Phycisphaera sp.]|nr:hypothetical protein [Phycisphaera sp.]
MQPISRPRSHALRCNLLALPVALATLAAGTAHAGPTWDVDYNDDAKATPATAQAITLTGPVLNIAGNLTGVGFDGEPDFVDMYLVDIRTPTLLRLSTAGGDLGGDASFDTQLFLFRRVGNADAPRALGLLANDNAAAGLVGSWLGNSANDGSGFSLVTPGFYYIAIAGLGVSAVGESGESIFTGLSTPGAIVFGGEKELADWAGQGATGSYSIRVEAVSGVPAPGAIALLGALLAAPVRTGRSRRA